MEETAKKKEMQRRRERGERDKGDCKEEGGNEKEESDLEDVHKMNKSW